jgi:hypothetical protein
MEDTSEDEQDESPEHGAGIDSGVDWDTRSGAALEEYGGNNIARGDSEDGCSESDIIESGILPLDQVNNTATQGPYYNKMNHHYCPTPHKKPMAQHSRSHSSTELPVLALQDCNNNRQTVTGNWQVLVGKRR